MNMLCGALGVADVLTITIDLTKYFEKSLFKIIYMNKVNYLLIKKFGFLVDLNASVPIKILLTSITSK